MKTRLSILLLLAPSLVCAQKVWEKRLGPGLLLRQEVDVKTPLVINALRFSYGSPTLKMTSWLAKDQIFDETSDKGREAVNQVVRRKNAVAGINGDFFQVPYNGDPMGLMIWNGQLVSAPEFPRSAFGWGDGKFEIAVPTWSASMTIGEMEPTKVDGLNEVASGDRVVVNSSAVGVFQAKAPNYALVAKVTKGAFKPGAVVEMVAEDLTKDAVSGKVPAGKVVIVACGARASALSDVKPGTVLSLTLNVAGFDWTKIQHVISGGPQLVKGGQVDVSNLAEKFRDSFTTKRHPRTAIGVTGDGELWLVTVDGRQKHSDGATLQELAVIMKRLGCAQAINLDGGGSTELAVPGMALNRPSDGLSRPVANGWLIVDTPGVVSEPKVDHKISMRFPGRLDVNGGFNLSLVEKGVKIPNSEILWSSAGNGWVDQGGTVRAWETGSVKVIAFCRGQRLEVSIPIGPEAKKP